MPAGTSAAMAGVAASQAAIAAQAAHQAEVSRCKGVIASFDSKNTTVGEAQDYAHCINVVYPQPASGMEMLVFKVAFVLALVGLVGGFAYAKKKGGWMYDSWGDYLLASLFGFIGVPCAVGFVAAIIYGIYWLFT